MADSAVLERLTEAADGQVREATSEDAVAGMPARWVASPADTAQTSAVLRAAAADDLAVVARGLGTKLHWGGAPERVDVVLDTTRLDRLVEHAAGDLVAVAGAGRRLADLQGDLANAGQWLAVDPPRPGTLGGLVATGSTGPTRLLHGPVRDLLIGSTMVRADGVVARSGGKVVKNVAGYDLGKLLTGSFGTLGVITEVAFRLHPVPQARSWVTVPVASPDALARLLHALVHSQLVPTAVELDAPAAGSASLGVLLEGIAPGVARRAEQAAGLLGGEARASDAAPQWWGREPGEPGDVLLKVTHELAAAAALLAAVQRSAEANAVALDVRGSVAVGTVLVAVRGGPQPEAAAGVVAGLRAAAPRFGGTVVVLQADAETRARTDVWGPVSALGVMRAVKQQFDPSRVLAPGRFVGGI